MYTIRFHIYISTSRDQSRSLIKIFFTQSRLGMMRLRNTYFLLLSSTLVPFGRPAFPPGPGLIAAAASPGAVTAPAPRSAASPVATSAPLRAAPAPLSAPAATSLAASAPSAAVRRGLHRPKKISQKSLFPKC
jgi:hypothetical protein